MPDCILIHEEIISNNFVTKMENNPFEEQVTKPQEQLIKLQEQLVKSQEQLIKSQEQLIKSQEQLSKTQEEDNFYKYYIL